MLNINKIPGHGRIDFVVSYPFFNNPNTTYFRITLNFLIFLKEINSNIVLISGDIPNEKIKELNINLVNLHYKRKKFIIQTIIHFLLYQLTISKYLLLKRREVKRIHFIGSYIFIIPIIVSKILRIKSFLIGVAPSYQRAKHDPTFVPRGFPIIFIKILDNITFKIADIIITESKSVKKFLNLKKNDQIFYAPLFFNEKINNIDERRLIQNKKIGFIGRLSKEKGILNLIKAISILKKENKNIKLDIIGDGVLKTKINFLIEEYNLKKEVNLIGLVSHELISQYLEKFVLLVIPSYTEGLPNVLVEAMSQGVPVLGNSVGGIPDLIEDGKTGFIMKNNSPECIAYNIMRSLNNPKLKIIGKKGREIIEKEFCYEAVVKKYKRIIFESNS